MTAYILLLALITSCGNTSGTTNETVTQNEPVEAASTTPASSTDEPEQNNMIVGEFKKEDLQDGAYASWFNIGYDGYTPSPEALETIKQNIGDYEIVVFMGTWCPDSRREVPQFIKLLDEAEYDLSNLRMVGVDRSKTTPDNLQEGHSIQRVPTFIFYKDGEEVNRYVEYAKDSLAEDIAAIVSKKEYKNSYAQ